VRDFLLGKIPIDWDVTTNAKPIQIKNIFSKTIDTGIKHGTVTVVINKKRFEVTTYRVDGEYLDYRRPKNIYFTDNLFQDLSRRDFTINAIAYNKTFIDPFNGKIDLSNRIIRCVGDPNQRFKEDALRMLRALRFSVTLNFSIEAETYDALIENISLIKFISIERIRDELIKLFLGENLNNIHLLIDTKILKFIDLDFHNYLKNHIHDVKKKLLRTALKNRNDKIILFCVLFHKAEADTSLNIIKKLKLDNKTYRSVKNIFRFITCKITPNSYAIKKIIFQLGWDDFYRLLTIKKSIIESNIDMLIIDKIYEMAHGHIHQEAIFIKDLKVNGNDIKALGIPDKKIGLALQFLIDKVHLHSEYNYKQKLISLLELFFN
jgi:tRNA nucleotidyltransferase (CCA-adding enzyme)